MSMSKALELANTLLAATPTGNESKPRRRTVRSAPVKPVYVPPKVSEKSARTYLDAIANAGKRQVMTLDPKTNNLVPKFYSTGPREGQPVMETDPNHIRGDQAKAVIAFLGEKAYHPAQHASALLRANAEAKRVLNPEPVSDKPYSRGTAAVANGFTPGIPVMGEKERKDKIAKRDLMVAYALEAAKKGDATKAAAFNKVADMLTQEISDK